MGPFLPCWSGGLPAHSPANASGPRSLGGESASGCREGPQKAWLQASPTSGPLLIRAQHLLCKQHTCSPPPPVGASRCRRVLQAAAPPSCTAGTERLWPLMGWQVASHTTERRVPHSGHSSRVPGDRPRRVPHSGHSSCIPGGPSTPCPTLGSQFPRPR